jgi:hypothetical protein
MTGNKTPPESLRAFTPLSTRYAIREGDAPSANAGYAAFAAGRPLRGGTGFGCASFKRSGRARCNGGLT